MDGQFGDEDEKQRLRRLRRATIRSIEGKQEEVPIPTREAYVAFGVASIGGTAEHWEAEYDRLTGAGCGQESESR